MKKLWYRLTLGLLVAGLLVYLFHAYPFAWPLLVNHPNGWLRTFLTDVVKTGSAGGPNPVVVMGFGGAILLVVYLSQILRPRTTHGSAGFAPWREVSQFALPGRVRIALSFLARLVVLPVVLLWTLITAGKEQATAQVSQLFRKARRTSSLIVGRCGGRTIALTEEQQHAHILTVAPTGSGKTSLLIAPNLLNELGTRSVFIADLKDSELLGLTGGAVARYHQVKVFAPLQPQCSHGYNPLAHIHSVADAQDFAACWVENTGRSKEEFWMTSSKLLMTAVALHLREIEPDAPFSRLTDILTGSTKAIQHLLDTTPSIDAQRVGKEFLKRMEEKDHEKLIASVLSDLGNRFQLLADPDIRAATASNEIDFEAMNDEVIALYLCVPRKATRRLKPLLATLTMQLFAAWERRGTLSKACYLDEFTKIGHVPDMADFLSMARHYRISVIMAIQDFAQMDETYGQQDARTIKANSVTHFVLPGVDVDEARYYSIKIGDTTVRTETHHTAGAGATRQDSWTQGEARRPLMTADEIRRLRKNTILMVSGSSQPLLVKGKPFYEIRRLARLAAIPYQFTRGQAQSAQSTSHEPSANRPGTQQPGPSQAASSINQNEDDDSRHFLRK